MGLGAVLLVAGLAGVPATDGGGAAVTTSAVTSPASSAVATTSATTIAGEVTTTTSAAAPETVESFVAEFSAALVRGDSEFIYDRLHPQAIEAYGAATCRNWVHTQIMTMSDYQLAGNASGPLNQPLPTPTGAVTVPDTFVAPVTFIFDSQKIRAQVGFVPIDGKIYWLGRCR
jgi:hypothetical protein